MKTSGNIGAQRRAVILSAALKTFAENGYKGASIQKIADRAGLPKTNILYYFSNKKLLYSAVMQSILSMWNSTFDNVTADDCPATSLATYIADKMEVSRLHPYSSKAFAIEIINGANNLDASFKKWHISWVEERKNVISEWIKAGKMDKVDPDFLLYQIWSSTQHYADFSAQITNLRGAPLSKEEFDEATSNVVNIILKGCGLTVPKAFTM